MVRRALPRHYQLGHLLRTPTGVTVAALAVILHLAYGVFSLAAMILLGFYAGSMGLFVIAFIVTALAFFLSFLTTYGLIQSFIPVAFSLAPYCLLTVVFVPLTLMEHEEGGLTVVLFTFVLGATLYLGHYLSRRSEGVSRLTVPVWTVRFWLSLVLSLCTVAVAVGAVGWSRSMYETEWSRLDAGHGYSLRIFWELHDDPGNSLTISVIQGRETRKSTYLCNIADSVRESPFVLVPSPRLDLIGVAQAKQSGRILAVFDPESGQISVAQGAYSSVVENFVAQTPGTNVADEQECF